MVFLPAGNQICTPVEGFQETRDFDAIILHITIHGNGARALGDVKSPSNAVAFPK
jgi:hypothetical protein